MSMTVALAWHQALELLQSRFFYFYIHPVSLPRVRFRNSSEASVEQKCGTKCVTGPIGSVTMSTCRHVDNSTCRQLDMSTSRRVDMSATRHVGMSLFVGFRWCGQHM